MCFSLIQIQIQIADALFTFLKKPAKEVDTASG